MNIRSCWIISAYNILNIIKIIALKSCCFILFAALKTILSINSINLIIKYKYAYNTRHFK